MNRMLCLQVNPLIHWDNGKITVLVFRLHFLKDCGSCDKLLDVSKFLQILRLQDMNIPGGLAMMLMFWVSFPAP